MFGQQKSQGSRFKIGTIVRTPFFYGRASELKTVLAHSWTWICGQRRVGKSSLLCRLEAEATMLGWAPLGFSLAYLDPRKATGRVLFDKMFFDNRRALMPHGLRQDQFETLDAEAAFKELAIALLEKVPEVMFLWDEAETLIDLEQNDPGFLDRLLAAVGGIDGVRFVFAGTQLLTGLYGRRARCSEFLGAFRWLPLGPLKKDEGISLLQAEQTGGWGRPLDAELVEQVENWCGGHPFLLQHAGALLEEKCRDDGYNRRPGLDTFDECRRELGQHAALRAIMADDFTKLTPAQQSVLSAACRRPEGVSHTDIAQVSLRSPEEIESAVAFLEPYGYLHVGEPVRLRFLFYRSMLPNITTSTADQERVDRICRRTVFVSYAHGDARWLKEISKFLHPVIAGGQVDSWDDRRISAGAQWRDEIERALERACVAVLLISSDFLNSQFIHRVELPLLLARARERQCRVLCLHVGWSALSDDNLPNEAAQLLALQAFQALNDPRKPLDAVERPDRQKQLVAIASEIHRWAVQ